MHEYVFNRVESAEIGLKKWGLLVNNMRWWCCQVLVLASVHLPKIRELINYAD